MKLFHGPVTSKIYQDKRKTMAKWIAGLCSCEETQASQCFNDIESHSGSSSGGGSGVTALAVTVSGTAYEVFHHSAGIAGTGNTCTVFWIQYPLGLAKVVAVGKHAGTNTYRIYYVAGSGFTFTSKKVPAVGSTINPF